MKVGTIRKYALSLDAASEAPHHQFSSFRVRGKIFATLPPGDEYLHLLLGEADREPALALYPAFVEKLCWGSKVLGLRIRLAGARPEVVKHLVARAHETRVLKDAGPPRLRRAAKP